MSKVQAQMLKDAIYNVSIEVIGLILIITIEGKHHCGSNDREKNVKI